MKIIFADSNKLYGLWRAMTQQNSTLQNSSLIAKLQISGHKIIISSFVLFEVQNYCIRDNIPYDISRLAKFIQYTGFEVFKSRENQHTYAGFVHDQGDEQILQDCIESGCTHLLTSNTKDFKSKSIHDQFHITIISEL